MKSLFRINNAFSLGFLSLACLVSSTILLAPGIANALAPFQYGFNFDAPEESLLNNHDPDDADDSDDGYEAEYDDYRGADSWDPDRVRSPRGIGKIEIDLKRPQSIVSNVFTNNLPLALSVVVGTFGLVGLGIYFGSKQFIPASRMKPPINNKRTHQRASTITSLQSKQDTLLQHYEILGVNPNVSDQELRERYLHLAKSFHSDKLANHDLPEEIRKLSEQQFIKIKTAYDAICEQRKI